jgi:cytochrome c nitrite reductase small subunit
MALGFGIAVVLLVVTGMSYSYVGKADFCGGCHSMGEHYTSWQESTHSSFKCNECHLPNNGLVPHMVAKAKAGMVDVYTQTAGKAPLPIHLSSSAKGQEYIRDNCVRCHGATIYQLSLPERKTDCTSCHRNLVHKEIN